MDITPQDIVFHIFAGVATVGSILVVFMANPIYCSFFLALVMSALGGLFFVLDAAFVAAAQIIVYAGAVMVLFVMVMMIFDLKKDSEDLTGFSPMTFLKIVFVGALCGVLMGVGWLASGATATPPVDLNEQKSVMIKNLSTAPTSAVTDAEDLKKEVVEITQNPQAGKDIFKDYSDTQKLSLKLFSKFVFAFEALSVLLLVAIVGSVALAKSRGGTHHGLKRPS